MKLLSSSKFHLHTQRTHTINLWLFFDINQISLSLQFLFLFFPFSLNFIIILTELFLARLYHSTTEHSLARPSLCGSDDVNFVQQTTVRESERERKAKNENIYLFPLCTVCFQDEKPCDHAMCHAEKLSILTAHALKLATLSQRIDVRSMRTRQRIPIVLLLCYVLFLAIVYRSAGERVDYMCEQRAKNLLITI